MLIVKHLAVVRNGKQMLFSRGKQFLLPVTHGRLSRTSDVTFHIRRLQLERYNARPPCLLQSSCRPPFNDSIPNKCANLCLIQRQFRTTPNQHIHPLIWIAVKPVAKLSAILTGRSLRRWLKRQPDEKRKYYTRMLLGAALSGIGVVATLILIHYYSNIQETPITKRKRFISLTPEQYQKVSQFEAESFLENYRNQMLPGTHPYYKQVLSVALRLVKGNQDFPGMKDHRWTICVVDNPEINAFVLPTGHVFVFTGLLEFVENDDQLAAILGHEMAHALLSHAAEKISFVQLWDYIVILFMAFIWTFLPNDGISLVTQWFYNKVADFAVHLPYSRTLEREADKVGLNLSAKACFDIRQGSVFWNKMDVLKKEEDKIPEWASTHPSDEKRVQLFDFLIPEALEVRKAYGCPSLPKIDPRIEASKLKYKVNDVKTAAIAKRNLTQVTKLTDAQAPAKA